MEIIKLILVENISSYFIYCGGLGIIVFLFQQRMREVVKEFKRKQDFLQSQVEGGIGLNKAYLDIKLKEIKKEFTKINEKYYKLKNSKRRYIRSKGSGRR